MNEKYYIVELEEEEANELMNKYFVNVVGELVQCNNCAHGTLCGGNIKCNKPGIEKYEMNLHPVDWFCADGEHKKGK